MKLALTALVVAILFAASASHAKAAEPKQGKDVAACDKEGDAAVAKAKLKHPLDATKVKQDAFNACMASRAHPGGKVRAK